MVILVTASPYQTRALRSCTRKSRRRMKDGIMEHFFAH